MFVEDWYLSRVSVLLEKSGLCPCRAPVAAAPVHLKGQTETRAHPFISLAVVLQDDC